jgi:hypothetical protein
VKRHLLTLALALTARSACLAYDWPVGSPAVLSTFGQQVDGHFGGGVSLVGQGTTVRAIAGGEVVFWYDPARRPTSVPRGTGAQIVVEHVERVRSAYSHLAPATVTRLQEVSATTALGAVGESGNALGPTLGLQLLDMETRSFLNPFAVLPLLRDAQPPVIARAVLRRGGVVSELGGGAAVSPGVVEVLVEAYDLRQDVPYRWRLAPYSIALSVNGRETASIVFDSLRWDGTRLVLGTNRAADPVLAGGWLLNLGEIQLQRGETRLGFFVRDYAGNETSREYYLSIKG